MIFSSERHMDWLVVEAKKKPRLLGVQLIFKEIKLYMPFLPFVRTKLCDYVSKNWKKRRNNAFITSLDMRYNAICIVRPFNKGLITFYKQKLSLIIKRCYYAL